MHEEIKGLIEKYYYAFQGEDQDAIVSCLLFPATFWKDQRLIYHVGAHEYATWQKKYLANIKAQTGLSRGEILALDIEPLNKTVALVRMLSSRLDVHDQIISTVRTGFIVNKTRQEWKISALISDIDKSVPARNT